MYFIKSYRPIKKVVDIIFIQTCTATSQNLFQCSAWTTIVAILKTIATTATVIFLLAIGNFTKYALQFGGNIKSVTSILQICSVFAIYFALQCDAIISQRNQVKFLNAIIDIEINMIVKLHYYGDSCDAVISKKFVRTLIIISLLFCVDMLWVGLQVGYIENLIAWDIFLFLFTDWILFLIIVIVIHICHLTKVIIVRYNILNNMLEAELTLENLSMVRLKNIVNILEKLFRLNHYFGKYIRFQLLAVSVMDFIILTAVHFVFIADIASERNLGSTLVTYMGNMVSMVWKLFYLVASLDRLGNQVNRIIELV